MDEATFRRLAAQARLLTSDYGTGYQRGLRRHYHGERFGSDAEHAQWMSMGTDHRAELGRGYRDGFAGKAPEPRLGRPTVPEDERASVSVTVRMTATQRAKLDRLGGAAWMRERIDKARE